MSKTDLEQGYTKHDCDKEPGREERQTNRTKDTSPYDFDDDDMDDRGFVQRNNVYDRL